MFNNNFSLAPKKYLNCPHLTKDIIKQAYNSYIVSKKSLCIFSHLCIYCGYNGNFSSRVYCSDNPSLVALTNLLNNNSIKEHLNSCKKLNKNSKIVLKINIESPEIYCFHCKDYRYCSLFDTLIGRQRLIRNSSNKDLDESKASSLTTIELSSSTSSSTSSSASYTSTPIVLENNMPDDSIDKNVLKRKLETNSSSNFSMKSRLPRGLINLGATCYLNSVVQVLLRLKTLNQSLDLHVHFLSHLLPHLGCLGSSSSSNYFSTYMTDKEYYKKYYYNFYENNKNNFDDIEIEIFKSFLNDSISSSFNFEHYISNPCLICEFMLILHSLPSSAQISSSQNSSLSSIISPTSFLYSFWNEVTYMSNYGQQDSHEFLLAFLSSYERILVNDKNITNGNSNKFSFIKNYSGKIESSITCLNCNDTSIKSETFIDLSLALINSNQSEPEEMDIYECLNNYTSIETLETPLDCSKCNSPQLKTKKLCIKECPNILIIHLKRFSYFDKKKNRTKINFPLKRLNLFSYLSSPSSSSYNLVGAICHSGSTITTGHYFSYVKEIFKNDKDEFEEVWLQCDDHKVSIASEDVVLDSDV